MGFRFGCLAHRPREPWHRDGSPVTGAMAQFVVRDRSVHLGAMWRAAFSADKHPCPVAAFDSRRQRSFSAVGHAFQAGLWGGLAATHLGEARRPRGHGEVGGSSPPIGEVEGDGATGGAVAGSSPRGSDWVQIWLGSGLMPCRLASDWLQIGFRLSSDWVQIGFRFGSPATGAMAQRRLTGHGSHGTVFCSR